MGKPSLFKFAVAQLMDTRQLVKFGSKLGDFTITIAELSTEPRRFGPDLRNISAVGGIVELVFGSAPYEPADDDADEKGDQYERNELGDQIEHATPRREEQPKTSS